MVEHLSTLAYDEKNMILNGRFLTTTGNYQPNRRYFHLIVHRLIVDIYDSEGGLLVILLLLVC